MNNVIPFPERELPQELTLTVDGLPLLCMEGSSLYLTDGAEELRHSHMVICGVLENLEAVMEERGLFDDECPCPDCQIRLPEAVIDTRFLTAVNDN